MWTSRNDIKHLKGAHLAKPLLKYILYIIKVGFLFLERKKKNNQTTHSFINKTKPESLIVCQS